MFKNTPYCLCSFPSLILGRFTLVLFFILFSFSANAQTVIVGLEYIVVQEGAVIYVDSTEAKPGLDEVVLVTKNAENNPVVSREKLLAVSKANKESKSRIKKGLPKQIEFTYQPKENDSSISETSTQKIVASSSNFQWNLIGIVVEIKYSFLQVLWSKGKTSEKENFFAEQSIAYKSSRAPPYC